MIDTLASQKHPLLKPVERRIPTLHLGECRRMPEQKQGGGGGLFTDRECAINRQDSCCTWWMPDSCEKALAPTMALLACTIIPVIDDTSFEDLTISFVLMLVKAASESTGRSNEGL